MLCTGGQQEADAAYQTAYNAIFVQGQKVHRHTQSRMKEGSRRWEVLEMWPMIVSGPQSHLASFACLYVMSIFRVCVAQHHQPLPTSRHSTRSIAIVQEGYSAYMGHTEGR